MSRSTRVILDAVVDGFGRLVELAPGAQEINLEVNNDDSSDWLLVGGDLWNAVEQHPDVKRCEHDEKELVEA